MRISSDCTGALCGETPVAAIPRRSSPPVRLATAARANKNTGRRPAKSLKEKNIAAEYIMKSMTFRLTSGANQARL